MSPILWHHPPPHPWLPLHTWGTETDKCACQARQGMGRQQGPGGWAGCTPAHDWAPYGSCPLCSVVLWTPKASWLVGRGLSALVHPRGGSPQKLQSTIRIIMAAPPGNWNHCLSEGQGWDSAAGLQTPAWPRLSSHAVGMTHVWGRNTSSQRSACTQLSVSRTQWCPCDWTPKPIPEDTDEAAWAMRSPPPSSCAPDGRQSGGLRTDSRAQTGFWGTHCIGAHLEDRSCRQTEAHPGRQAQGGHLRKGTTVLGTSRQEAWNQGLPMWHRDWT